jgi:hypothetical protein
METWMQNLYRVYRALYAHAQIIANQDTKYE